MIRIFLPVTTGPKKITRVVKIQSEHIARRGTWTKPSSRVPSRSNSPGHHPQWVLAHPFSPYHPPPSTTFQFILSCWLARFTTKFPLARRSSLHTLYLPLPLLRLSLSFSFPLSASSFLACPRYLILRPSIFINFYFYFIYRYLF